MKKNNINQKNLQNLFQLQKINVLISFSYQTRLWFNQISTSAGLLFIEPQQSTLFVDSRYIEDAIKNAQNSQVKLWNNQEIDTFVASKKYLQIGFEEEYCTYQELKKIKTWFPNAKLIPFSGQKLRIIKAPFEIEYVQKAAQITLKALDKLKPYIKAGISEKELDARLEFFMRDLGADKSSFDAIIASGTRSSLPHGRASEKILKEGEFVTIDCGAFYKGYGSDITRNFHIGKVNNVELLRIEEVVKDAQAQGIGAVRPGLSTQEIDKICRDYITEQGYGKYFVHSTGHGLGIDVHELPNVTNNKTLNTILEPGMIITIEPGIYIPNLGGVRMEDDILVTKNGYQVLSKL